MVGHLGLQASSTDQGGCKALLGGLRPVRVRSRRTGAAHACAPVPNMALRCSQRFELPMLWCGTIAHFRASW